jgi:hypothetical protein
MKERSTQMSPNQQTCWPTNKQLTLPVAAQEMAKKWFWSLCIDCFGYRFVSFVSCLACICLFCRAHLACAVSSFVCFFFIHLPAFVF